MTYALCFFASFAGTLVAILLARRIFRDVAGQMTHAVSVETQAGAVVSAGTQAKRKPVYGTPEKAALAESIRDRSLPAQWNK